MDISFPPSPSSLPPRPESSASPVGFILDSNLLLAHSLTIFVLQRGGAGNIKSTNVKPTNPPSHPGDKDVVPEAAKQVPGPGGSGYENYHIGRGGEGNVHREHHEGLAEELKEKMTHPFGGGHKE